MCSNRERGREWRRGALHTRPPPIGAPPARAEPPSHPFTMAQPGEATPASPADASAEAADVPAPPPDDAALAAFLGSDGEEHDGDAAAGSDGDAAPSLPRSGLLARRLAAVRRLHAAYARQYTVLAAAAAEGEAKGRKRQRAAGCPPRARPRPRRRRAPRRPALRRAHPSTRP